MTSHKLLGSVAGIALLSFGSASAQAFEVAGGASLVLTRPAAHLSVAAADVFGTPLSLRALAEYGAERVGTLGLDVLYAFRGAEVQPYVGLGMGSFMTYAVAPTPFFVAGTFGLRAPVAPSVNVYGEGIVRWNGQWTPALFGARAGVGWRF